jgi:hypothetical protein
MTDSGVVKRDFMFVNCQSGDHKWKSIGGKNCGCVNGYCSIPVYTCEVCGDCDYGDNEEAREIRLDCECVAELN